MLQQFIAEHGSELLYAFCVLFLGFIGFILKRIEANSTAKTKEAEKKGIADKCVKFVEQVYKNLPGADKLVIAMETAMEMLGDQKISCTELELRVLIESALAEQNDVFNYEAPPEEVVAGEDVPADEDPGDPVKE